MGAVKTFIAGVETPWHVPSGMGYQRAWGTPGAARAVYVVGVSTQPYSKGDAFTVKLGTTVLWSGEINYTREVSPIIIDHKTYMLVEVVAKEDQQALDDLRIWRKYADQEAGTSIADIAAEYLTGFTVTNVVAGPVIEETVKYEGATVWQAIIDLTRRASQAGADADYIYFSWVAPGGDIYFQIIADLPAAGFDLTDSPVSKAYRALEVQPSTADYYNICAYYMAPGELPEKTYSFTRDAAEVKIDLFGDKPCDVSEVRVDGSPEPKGQFGVNDTDPATYSWLFERNAKIITRTDPAGAFGTAEDIEVDACVISRWPYIARNQAEIDLRGEVWGAPQTLSEVRDLAGLVDYAESDIRRASRYGAEVVRYETHRDGLDIGQAQTLTLSDRNLGDTFVITAVEAHNVPGSRDLLSYSVEAHAGEAAIMLREMVRRAFSGPPAGRDDDEVFRVPISQRETVTLEATFGFGAGSAAVPIWAHYNNDFLVSAGAGALAQWDDDTGNARHASATGTQIPTVVTGVVNGRPVVRFDGANDVLAFTPGGTILSSRTVTIYAVMAHNAASIDGILSLLRTSGGPSVGLRRLGTGTGAVDWPSLASLVTTSNPGLSTFFLITLLWDGDSSAALIRFNGVEESASGGASTTSTDFISVRLGEDENNAFWQGDIAEVIIYDTAHTLAQIIQNESYLTNRFNIGLPSPSGPPTANLLAHYDNDALASHGAGALAQWDDASGNGYHVSEATNQPTVVTGVLNGRPVARFDGIDDFLSYDPASNFHTGSAMTMYVVAKVNTGGKKGLCLWEEGTPVTGWDFGIERDSGGKLQWVNASGIQTLTDPGTSFFLCTLIWDRSAALGTIRFNGVDEDTGSASSGLITFERIYLGKHFTTGFWDGDIAEVIIYDTVHGASALAQTEAYLNDRFSIY